jgi:hypothetical protein
MLYWSVLVWLNAVLIFLSAEPRHFCAAVSVNHHSQTQAFYHIYYRSLHSDAGLRHKMRHRHKTSTVRPRSPLVPLIINGVRPYADYHQIWRQRTTYFHSLFIGWWILCLTYLGTSRCTTQVVKVSTWVTGSFSAQNRHCTANRGRSRHQKAYMKVENHSLKVV